MKTALSYLTIMVDSSCTCGMYCDMDFPSATSQTTSGGSFSSEEQGFYRAMNFDLSYVEYMKERLNDKEVSPTPVFVGNFWKAFEEGNQLAEDVMSKYPKAEDNNE